MHYNSLFILGATASGKTKLAVAIAQHLQGEIISADSRQIFKRMDIGTGKDLTEYRIADEIIPYHLIDILEPGERYHVDAFKNDFFTAFEQIQTRKKLPIVCGGTGLYLQSVLQNQPYTAVPVNDDLRNILESLDKESLIERLYTYPAEQIKHVDLDSKKRIIRAIEIAEYLQEYTLIEVPRPTIHPLVIGLKNEVTLTRKKILNRLEARFEAGMIEEVAVLLKEGVPEEMLVFYGLEYKFIVQYLKGEMSLIVLKEKLGIAICQYAKRQNTYFRKMEKDGIRINWLDASLDINQLKQQVLQMVLR
ncbi:tRNA (adenosine(37)-N6)-dimethylallyltransferase MiaA [Pedobacter sp. MW01-1-1]|uniref:tRNA (adenosine(37)-N6)-dimethylallyltransferase MiaA n=1 Tax=Pedobacter sp. MW01-1-1 TaxID=3383027 RepID=UPI003FEF8426